MILRCSDHRRVENVIEQMIEAAKQHNPESASQLVPELFSGGKAFAAALIGRVGQFKDLMDEEGQEVEDKKVHGQELLSVAIVMFNLVALIFQGIEGFVFDFPAGASAFNQVLNIVSGNREIGYPTVMVGGFPLFIDEPVLEEIDLIGVSRAIQGDIVHPVIQVTPAFLIRYFKMVGLLQCGEVIDPFKEDLVVGRLCHKDEGHGVFFEAVYKRLLGIEVIAGDDDAKLGMGFSNFPEDSFSGVDLTVLLDGAIGVLDGFREKRDHLPQVGMNDHRLENLMMITGFSMLVFGLQTTGTTDLFRSEIFRSVQRHEVFSIQKPVLLKLLAALERAEKV